jgi:hypothetical protein
VSTSIAGEALVSPARFDDTFTGGKEWRAS